MKPFDLEAAKRGEPIVSIYGDEIYFIGIRNDGRIAIETPDNWMYSYKQSDICMAPKKRTVWLNLYKPNSGSKVGQAYHYESEGDAEMANGGYKRIGGKAYPVEIEE